MTREEESALRYVAGYACRKVMGKLELSSHPNKEDMILCILELSGMKIVKKEGQKIGRTYWTEVGVVQHVSDSAYNLFDTMEDEVRTHFKPKVASQMKEGTRDATVSAILSNEDILFQWCIFMVDADDVDGKKLLGSNIILHFEALLLPILVSKFSKKQLKNFTERESD